MFVNNTSLTKNPIFTRRHFFKVGVIGILIASPVAITIIKRNLQGDSYEYVLKGPFQLPESSNYCSYEEVYHWSGGKRNAMYTPQRVYWQSYDEPGKDDSEVTFTILFNVETDAPVNLLAQVTLSLYAGGKVIASEETQWIAPHKQPLRVSYPYKKAGAIVSSRPPEEYLSVTCPYKELDKIEKLVVHIHELVTD